MARLAEPVMVFLESDSGKSMSSSYADYRDQSTCTIRFDWGEQGLNAIGPGSSVIVIVDVLSFCTCVDVACARGAAILPYRWKDDRAVRFADEHQAVLASSQREGEGYTLSPAALTRIPAGTRLVLPSPNGAALSPLAGAFGTTVAACLRNAAAIAAFAQARAGPIAVIGCGERWPDGSLRPAWEDFIGAGAVIAHLSGSRSPEAEAAYAAFRQAEPNLRDQLRGCASGRELLERGFAADVNLATELCVSRCVPLLDDRAFINAAPVTL